MSGFPESCSGMTAFFDRELRKSRESRTRSGRIMRVCAIIAGGLTQEYVLSNHESPKQVHRILGKE
jgi:hypothetical protein